jgi:hypothetical protein
MIKLSKCIPACKPRAAAAISADVGKSDTWPLLQLPLLRRQATAVNGFVLDVVVTRKRSHQNLTMASHKPIMFYRVRVPKTRPHTQVFKDATNPMEPWLQLHCCVQICRT